MFTPRLVPGTRGALLESVCARLACGSVAAQGWTAVPEVTGTEKYIESSFNFTIFSPVLCGLGKQ